MKKIALCFSVLTLLCAALPAHANDHGFLGFSIGYFNALDDEDHEADFRIEYRPATPIFLKRIKPWAGLELTSQASLWVGGGILAEFNLTDRLSLIPSFGTGLYMHGGSDTDLDYPIQFRSQLEMAYSFANKSKVSVAISHLSNANLGDSNGGAEAFSVYYMLPLDKVKSLFSHN